MALVAHAERAIACDPMEPYGYVFRALACSVQGKPRVRSPHCGGPSS